MNSLEFQESSIPSAHLLPSRLACLEEHTSELCHGFGTAAESLGTGANPNSEPSSKAQTLDTTQHGILLVFGSSC